MVGGLLLRSPATDEGATVLAVLQVLAVVQASEVPFVQDLQQRKHNMWM